MSAVLSSKVLRWSDVDVWDDVSRCECDLKEDHYTELGLAHINVSLFGFSYLQGAMIQLMANVCHER